MTDVKELKAHFVYWRAIQQCEGRPYPPNDEASFQLLAERASRYGAFTNSGWSRAAKELADEGKIQLRTPPPQPTPIPADFEQTIRAMTSTELRIKLNRDPAFAELFERHARGEKPEGVAASDEYQLSAAQWRGLPPSVASIKMRSPAFRAQVQRLIDRGEI